MPRVLILALFACVIIGAPALAAAQTATPEASPAAEDPRCGDLQHYRMELRNANPHESAEIREALDIVVGVPFQDLSMVRSEHLVTTALFIDELASNLEQMDVPPIVQDVHDGYVARLVLITRIIQAQAEGRIFDAMALISQIDRNIETVEAAVEPVAAACGAQWERTAALYRFMWTGWYD